MRIRILTCVMAVCLASAAISFGDERATVAGWSLRDYSGREGI